MLACVCLTEFWLPASEVAVMVSMLTLSAGLALIERTGFVRCATQRRKWRMSIIFCLSINDCPALD